MHHFSLLKSQGLVLWMPQTPELACRFLHGIGMRCFQEEQVCLELLSDFMDILQFFAAAPDHDESQAQDICNIESPGALAASTDPAGALAEPQSSIDSILSVKC